MISQNEHNFSITEKNVLKVCVLCFDVCDLFKKKRISLLLQMYLFSVFALTSVINAKS